MPRRRSSSNNNSIAQGIVLILLIGYGSLAGFWKSLTIEEKWIFGSLGILAFILLMSMIVVLILYRKKKRREAWEKAMNSLQNRLQSAGNSYQLTSARNLSANELEKFAMQVYRKMGYVARHTGHTGDHGVDVRLVDPNGNVELVQCKQWNKPVGEPEVRDLMGAMVHEKAIRGYIWAPGGFSQSARKWAEGKKIVLADEGEINRLVEIAFGTQ